MAKGIPLTVESLATLAELTYMHDGGKKWSELAPEMKEKYRKRVDGFFDNLAKINFEMRPAGEQSERRINLKLKKEEITNFMREWIKKNVKVPKNLDKLFPCEEFVIHLVRKFESNEGNATAKKD